ncbi:MAG TPA: hypothetical protein DCS12_04240 [Clostridiales bacterium]|nr:hypothetical protein [Clostridiales bacterium]
MSKAYKRDEALARLKATIRSGKPIIIGGAGDGFVAKLEEMGGTDIIGIYNSSYTRHLGYGPTPALFATNDANSLVLDEAPKICAAVKEAIIIAGFCAQNPITNWERWCAEMHSIGVTAFMNFPTVGMMSGSYRQMIEDAGYGFKRECEILKIIHDLGYLTLGYAFDLEEVEMVCNADVDIVGCHAGGTTGGLIGFKSAMDEAQTIKLMNEMIEVARKTRPKLDFLPIIHGGIMESPETTEPILKATGAVGYLGASSIERTPVEKAVIKVCQDFKNMKMNIAEWIKL